jgi:hypothetical protein
MSCAHKTSSAAGAYTAAAIQLGNLLAAHNIPTNVDQFPDLMDIYWTMLQRGPVILDCSQGLLTFHQIQNIEPNLWRVDPPLGSAPDATIQPFNDSTL